MGIVNSFVNSFYAERVWQGNTPEWAEKIVFELDDGWYFCTHEGNLIGPNDKDVATTTAAIYLESIRGERPDP